MNKLPLASLRRDVNQGRVIRKSLLITLAALIHVPIALAILSRAATMFV